LAVLCEVDV
jgi:hypothetical protein